MEIKQEVSEGKGAGKPDSASDGETLNTKEEDKTLNMIVKSIL